MKNDHYLLSSGMHNQQYQVFTNKSLDGAVSLLTFLWSKPNHTISFRELSYSELSDAKNQLKRTLNPPETFVFGLMPNNNFFPDFDESYITIIDHHKSSENLLQNFKKSKVLCKEYSSSSLLIRKLYLENAPEFTEKQKKLILLADDYESLKLQFKESFDLNVLFLSEYKNNFSEFIKTYRDGFSSFTDIQKNKIDSVKNQIISESKKLQKFGGVLEIKGNKKNTLGIVITEFNNLIIDYIVQNNNFELFFFINTKAEKVIIKQKRSETPIDLSKFAEKFCEGGGNNYTATGKITPLFMELTKNLKPL